MKLKFCQIAVAFTFIVSSYANAGVALIWGDAPFGLSQTNMNNFYNSLSGDSSSIATGPLNTVNLTGVNLLWATQPVNAYTSAELNTMSNFLSGGGRIAFMGEHGQIAPTENSNINTALSFLGSSISIFFNQVLDGGFRTATVGNGQILSNALTAGVNSYTYAAFAPLSIGSGAQALMLGQESFLGNPSVMMGYQNIGPGSIFLITDQNVWDGETSNWPGFDNGQMFANLLSASTGAPPVNGSVPESTSLTLLGIGLAGFGAMRRRKTA